MMFWNDIIVIKTGLWGTCEECTKYRGHGASYFASYRENKTFRNRSYSPKYTYFPTEIEITSAVVTWIPLYTDTITDPQPTSPSLF